MTPVDVAADALALGWRGLVVLGHETQHLSTMSGQDRAIYAVQVGALALVLMLIALWVLEAVAVARWARRQAPMVTLAALTHPVVAGLVAALVAACGITGLWHWWGGVASMAVAGAAWVVVTDRTMQPDHSPAVMDDEEEDA